MPVRLFQVLKLLVLAGVYSVIAVVLWERLHAPAPPAPPFDPQWVRLSADEVARLPLAERWDMPMGGELGELTYNAQPFLTTRHLGDDLNGIGGYNSDLGDAVYAAALGRVVYAGVPSPGWGNVVILAHRVRDPVTGELKVLQSMYAHLAEIRVKMNEMLQRGQVLGTVGTADGRYLAHLHFELRRGAYVNPSTGYSDAPLNRISPERYIFQRRGVAPEVRDAPPSLPSAGGS